MVFDHAQSPRLGQPTPVESTSVRIFTGTEIPEAAWTGQMIYRSDLQVLQVFNGDAWEDVVGGVAGLLTFVGDDPPIAVNVGDLWFDSDDGNKLYRWDGFSWMIVTPEQELDVQLDNGGKVFVPNDGSVAQFYGVSASFTDVVVEDQLSILGVNNRIGGALSLDSNILPPSDPPSVVDEFADEFLGLSAPSSAYVGLGDNGTQWETARILSRTIFGAGSGSSDWDYTVQVQAYTIDKTTGLVASKYVNSYISLFTFTDTGFANPPNPILTSFHSTANNHVYMFYVPSFSTSSGIKGGLYFIARLTPTGFGSTGWQWSSYAAYRYPAIFTDDTNVYVTATHKSDTKVYTFRYPSFTGPTGGVQIGTSSVQAGADWNGLYVGNADYGSQRFVMSYPGSTVHVWNGNTFSGSEAFTRSADVQIRGLVWDGTNFYTHHTDSTIRKYSTRTISTTKAFTYTWYNSVSAIESTPSAANSHVCAQRKWTTVTTSPIPITSDTGSPDSVQIYADNHLQGTPPTLGRTGLKIEDFTTSGVAAPSTDGFLAVDGFGRVISEALNDLDDPAVELRGNGYWRLDSTRDLGDTGWVLIGSSGNPAFENSWTNYGSGYAEAAYRKKMGIVYLQGLVKNAGLHTVIFTLPTECCPTERLMFSTASAQDSTYQLGRVDVLTNGQVAWQSGGYNNYFSLNGVSFVVD